ncbi:MAG: heme ABC exporter ATP-binding protein CcmA [Parvibaculum sp.]
MRLEGVELACLRGGRLVFEGLSFALEGGEVLELTGPNGAGKSSLLRQMAGLLELAAGRLVMTPDNGDVPLSARLHYVGHQDALKPAMSVVETAHFWAGYLGGGSDIEAALGALDLAALANLPVAYLSAGQKRRLALSRLMLAPRPLWLLDEPTVGLDTASIARLVALMERHLGAGGMIVAATHLDLGLGVIKTLNLASLAGTETP